MPNKPHKEATETDIPKRQTVKRTASADFSAIRARMEDPRTILLNLGANPALETPTPPQIPIPSRNPVLYRPDTVSESDTVSEIDTVPESDTVLTLTKDYLKVGRDIFDVVQPMLQPSEWALYSRLWRLSYGFNRNTCVVGAKALIRATNLKETVLREVIQKLVNRRLVTVLEVVNTRELKGTKYRVHTPSELGTVSESGTVSGTETVSESNSSIHDHDLNTHDHHQSAVMTMFQTLTGKAWTKADTASYRKIADLPVERIEQMMTAIHNRAADRPGSMAYYVKSILAELSEQKGSQPRAAARKRLEKFAQDIRAAHIGDPNYSISDLVYDLKDRCAREGVVWDDDLANEVLG